MAMAPKPKVAPKKAPAKPKLDINMPVSKKDAAAMRKQQAETEMERKMRAAAKAQRSRRI